MNSYYIYHQKIIESISDKQIEEDLDIIYYFNDRTTEETPYIKLYCSSRDEAVEKYEKNIEDSISSREI